jgi:N-methylhydantoinase A/oxoprolinase/acetone carboxylase beta subunit
MVAAAWRGLEEKVADEFAKSGVGRERIGFQHAVRMQYYGQLNDIEIVSPHPELAEAGQVDALIATFDDAYGKVYARSARSPELGFLITHAIVTGSVPVETPALPDQDPVEGAPPEKDRRPVHWGEGPAETAIHELAEVRTGHEIAGPAIVESVATTFAIPPGRSARLDRHQIFHLSASEEG